MERFLLMNGIRRTAVCAVLPLIVLAGMGPVSPSASAAERPLDVFGGAKWAFNPGYEFPGATGNRRFETVDGRDALVVNYDFTAGGAYVIAGTRVEVGEEAAGLRFDVRADRDLKILVRLEDAEKQTHQYSLLYDTPGEWKTLSIDLREPPQKSFGGPADGVMHRPIAKMWIGVGRGGTTIEPGEAAFSRIRTID